MRTCKSSRCGTVLPVQKFCLQWPVEGYPENKLLLISSNFTPKPVVNFHQVALTKWHTRLDSLCRQFIPPFYQPFQNILFWWCKGRISEVFSKGIMRSFSSYTKRWLQWRKSFPQNEHRFWTPDGLEDDFPFETVPILSLFRIDIRAFSGGA